MKDFTIEQCEAMLRKISEHHDSRVCVGFDSDRDESPVRLMIFNGEYYGEQVGSGATLQEALRDALEKIYREADAARSSHVAKADAELQKQREVLALLGASASPECDCDRSGIGGSHEDHCATVVL